MRLYPVQERNLGLMQMHNSSTRKYAEASILLFMYCDLANACWIIELFAINPLATSAITSNIFLILRLRLHLRQRLKIRICKCSSTKRRSDLAG
jgi:hypothetical protein